MSEPIAEIQAAFDPHVHGRGFAQSDKETPNTVARAAVAGGVGTILLMPNYEPRDARPTTLERIVNVQNEIYRAGKDDHESPACDFGMWAAALPGEQPASSLQYIVRMGMGIKWYVEITQGQDQSMAVDDFVEYGKVWHEHATPYQPIAAHVEDENIEEAIAKVAGEIGHPLIVPHINNRFLMDAVIRAKKSGLPVYGEVTWDHLFRTEEDARRIGWRSRMKPPLATQGDQDYLWAQKDWWDWISTDHAPHTTKDKDKADTENPDGKVGAGEVMCFGTPTIEAFMPLAYTAYKQGRLTEAELVEKTSKNAAAAFGVKLDPRSKVRIVEEEFEFGPDNVFSKCGWNAFEGQVMAGRVKEVDIHGTTVFSDGAFLDVKPQGKVLHPSN